MNLLSTPFLSTAPGTILSLPGLFAAMARDEVRGFTRLRPHQRASWHMFRVQLAALALKRADLSAAPEDQRTWADLLRALTLDWGDDPWTLVVPDRARPAFLQPPDPGGLKWETVPTPDALDLLITARNHDLKAAIATTARAEDWVYALVSLQTSEGFGGRSNYGIARMNRGSSSRAMLSLAPASGGDAPDPSRWWRRDVEVLLGEGHAGPLTPGGAALLWCLPWAEGTQLTVRDLDPWFIEVCRRIRLVEPAGSLAAERAGSETARVDAKAFNGALGDPWAPVALSAAQPKALTLAEGSFDYRRLVELLLSGDWEIPLSARVRDAEAAGELVLVAEALSRGNSKTDGLKTRTVPMPEHVRGLFLSDRERLSTAAQALMEDIKNAENALRDAIRMFVVGGSFEKYKSSRNFDRVHKQRAETAVFGLNAHADATFFRHLWALSIAMGQGQNPENAARSAFRGEMAAAARVQFAAAVAMIPCPSIVKPRARARATARLDAALRRNLPMGENAHV